MNLVSEEYVLDCGCGKPHLCARCNHEIPNKSVMRVFAGRTFVCLGCYPTVMREGLGQETLC